jgi:hypothetical protein
MRLVLRLPAEEIRVRIFAYAVTGSGRSKPHERRVEITTTYMSGLKRAPRCSDIVLGIDRATDKYVGIDSRRLRMGGETHNASSFFDLEGLSVKRGEMLINPRFALNTSFPGGVEHHAFFDGTRLAEYLFNSQNIHSGLYSFTRSFTRRVTPSSHVTAALGSAYDAFGNEFVLSSRNERRTVAERGFKTLVAAVEQGDLAGVRGRKVTPEQLKRILNLRDEIGILGEQYVLTQERKRLRQLGFLEIESKVERVSLRSVSEGFDILSFEDDGVTRRYLEVKATSGDSAVIEMSLGEWRAARRLGEHYYLARVVRVKEAPSLYYVRNPVKLEEQGLVTRIPSGWRVDLHQAMTAPST